MWIESVNGCLVNTSLIKSFYIAETGYDKTRYVVKADGFHDKIASVRETKEEALNDLRQLKEHLAMLNFSFRDDNE